MYALKNIMNICDFLTWSKEHKGCLGLMINSFIIMSLYESSNAPSYKITLGGFEVFYFHCC